MAKLNGLGAYIYHNSFIPDSAYNDAKSYRDKLCQQWILSSDFNTLPDDDADRLLAADPDHNNNSKSAHVNKKNKNVRNKLYKIDGTQRESVAECSAAAANNTPPPQTKNKKLQQRKRIIQRTNTTMTTTTTTIIDTSSPNLVCSAGDKQSTKSHFAGRHHHQSSVIDDDEESEFIFLRPISSEIQHHQLDNSTSLPENSSNSQSALHLRRNANENNNEEELSLNVDNVNDNHSEMFQDEPASSMTRPSEDHNRSSSHQQERFQCSSQQRATESNGKRKRSSWTNEVRPNIEDENVGRLGDEDDADVISDPLGSSAELWKRRRHNMMDNNEPKIYHYLSPERESWAAEEEVASADAEHDENIVDLIEDDEEGEEEEVRDDGHHQLGYPREYSQQDRCSTSNVCGSYQESLQCSVQRESNLNVKRSRAEKAVASATVDEEDDNHDDEVDDANDQLGKFKNSTKSNDNYLCSSIEDFVALMTKKAIATATANSNANPFGNGNQFFGCNFTYTLKK